MGIVRYSRAGVLQLWGGEVATMGWRSGGKCRAPWGIKGQILAIGAGQCRSPVPPV